MLAVIAVLFVIGMSVLWIQASHTYPEADQKAVSWVSYLMTQNNFLFLSMGNTCRSIRTSWVWRLFWRLCTV